MIPDSFPCQLISWDESYELGRRLAYEIKRSGFRPDLIVAIGRGGYVPARVVSDFLLFSLLASIKIEHWDTAACERPQASVRFPLAVDVQSQKVLIIDDVTDTGKTLRTAVDYMKELGAAEVRTGVLQHKTVSPFVPDYYAEKVAEWRWIIYPWAAHEDLVGLAERILSEEDLSTGEIGERLKGRYGLILEESTLLEVVEELVAMGKVEIRDERYRKI
ncbi:MAG: phosphoribosyltransferase [Methanothrix sp.]|jgi:hypoxanthine phosphoribosyltransferase|uniref:phosphoribosyltransferase n=3 Tax=Methanothrix sp. TaxID=90426 RepID=UPI001BD6645A|nr:phosphoribosyltransferase [Methanothrix sp.]MBK7387075.1 phosphoribosyltransferase [Methanothrix sp.]HPW72607.1 phosphoribosyltransferase [Methanothrix sp.]